MIKRSWCFITIIILGIMLVSNFVVTDWVIQEQHKTIGYWEYVDEVNTVVIKNYRGIIVEQQRVIKELKQLNKIIGNTVFSKISERQAMEDVYKSINAQLLEDSFESVNINDIFVERLLRDMLK